MSADLLHLVLGDAAGGVVRAACADHGLPGSVHVIPDDLSHGPLHDGKVRLRYMRASFVGYDRWEMRVTDAFACWDALDARLAAAPPKASELAIWAGDNSSEAVLVVMACHRLEAAEHNAAESTGRGKTGAGVRPAGVRDGHPGGAAVPAAGAASGADGETGVQVAHVGLPRRRNRFHVAQFRPADLVGLFGYRRGLAPAQRAEQAAIFRRLRAASRAETGQLRLWQRGELVAVPADRLDPLLLRACSSDWRPAAGVVGSVMAGCDPHNLASDLFLTGRLRRLIDRGRIEALGPGETLQDYWVRLAVD